MSKKGFTLLELLAVIVILSIVLVISIPSIINAVNNSHMRTYEYNLDALKSIAKDYVINKGIRIDNKEQKIINITQMIEDSYIKVVKDPKTQEACEGFVTVTRDNNNYIYESYLKCGENYISDNYYNINKNLPTMIILGSNPINIYIGDTYIDAGATAKDYYNVDITSKIIVTSNMNTSIPGTYTVTYSVIDNTGNIGITTRTINVIDNTSPTIAFDPNSNTTYAKSKETVIKVSDIGGLSDNGLKYVWSTSTTQPSLSLFTSLYKSNQVISTPASITGIYYLWAMASDKASNQAIKSSGAFYMDNTKPVITLNGSSSLTIEIGSTYTDAGATATDAHSGISGSVTSTGTVNPNVLGTYTITYNVSDKAGNAADPVTRTIRVADNTPPTITFGKNGNSSYVKMDSTTVTVNDNVAVNASSLKYQWTTSTTTPSEASFTSTYTSGETITSQAGVTGIYYLWIIAKDTSDNTTIQRTNVFNLDNTKPVITLNGSSSLTIEIGSTYTDVGANATDAHSGISGSVTSTGTVNPNVLGTYTITYNVSDKAGNAADPVTRTIRVADNTPPTITFGKNGNSSYVKTDSTTVTVNDNVAVNASSLKYQWTTSTTPPSEASYTNTFTSGSIINTPTGATGIYYLWIIASDSSGNKTTARTFGFYLDNTAPTYSSYSIKNVSSSGYDVFIYGVSDPQSGVNRVQFPTWTTLNGQDDIQPNWGTSLAAKGTDQGNGTWYYRVNITDHKGEYGQYNTHVYLYDNLGNSRGIALPNTNVPINAYVTATNAGSDGYATLVTPASESNPTILCVKGTGQGLTASLVINNLNIKAGDTIRVDYSFTRSNNLWYLDLVDNLHASGTYLHLTLDYASNGKNFSKTFTAASNSTYYMITLQKTNITDASYYATAYIQSVYLNGVKIF